MTQGKSLSFNEEGLSGSDGAYSLKICYIPHWILYIYNYCLETNSS